ncbi:MAG TPA: transcription-repair coupling factor [Tepidisphaeraceae bacterium]|jgi:transcription-repair coupling factor (superfamily II helicase)
MNPTLPGTVGRLLNAPELHALADSLGQNRLAAAYGVWGSGAAAVASSVAAKLNRPLLFVCGHLDEADDVADDVQLFTGDRPVVLPSLDVSGGMGRVSEEQASDRMRRILALSQGKQPPAMVAPVQSLMQPVPAKDEMRHLTRNVGVGVRTEPEKLIVWLAEHGYNRVDQCEVPGDFAVRGGIIDVYLPGEFEGSDVVGLPARIDFFGDQVESIRRFDIDTLGSGETLNEVQLVDIKGQIKSTSEQTHLLRYLSPETIIVMHQPLEIQEQARSYLDRVPDQRGIYPLSALLRHISEFAVLELSDFDVGLASLPMPNGQEAERVALPIKSIQKFETEAKKAIRELLELSVTHEVVVFCENDGEKDRLGQMLEAEQPGGGRVQLTLGYLHRGFVWNTQDSEGADYTVRPIALMGHHELFHRFEVRRRQKKVINAKPVDSFLDLNVGDYVVHVAHGIAKFTGLHTMQKDGKSEEYLTLRFAENAVLHVPAARINLIQKYAGGFSGSPTLSRLGSGLWEKQKEKVAEAVMDMAAELIDVQAARNAEVGTTFPPDTEWQREFEAEFPYTPTQDQVNAAEEIKQDMMKPRPMDRLLCGDVGYGKTEMAMRAAFKAIESGRQVAVLVPTTVLAEQHYRSFSSRMKSYPFTVESISRFKTTKQSKDITKRLSEGKVDVIIGTHRLLSKDVRIPDLGLVVVDEEQRFGVTHKERLKQMRTQVDVLTMSATPIPRTLHMSMLGIRDISSLTTAPQDRRSVVTEVMGYDPNRIKLSILRELQREGQVYFVHNRVTDIQEQADKVQQLVPDARIIIGHGQMADGEMEDAMMKFIRHEADILVCTTIIESGLDIANANTMIINNADRFGLSELHQLRGRVGRWKHRAYCYLLLPPDRPVTPIAAKRLKAIEEYSHLGAGFKIAMRDLELRGAGNILGPEQSGHIATVGYEMYCQLLEEAVHQLKHDKKIVRPEAHVDIGVTAILPKQYVVNDRQRMDVYRRLTRCSDVETVHALQKDVTDAYGELPRQAVVLFALTELRLLAGLFGISSIVKKDPDVVLTVADAQRASFALTGAPGRLTVVDEKTIYLRLPPTFLEADTLLLAMCNLMRAAKAKEVAATSNAPAAEPPAITLPPPTPPAAPAATKPSPTPPVSSARQKEAARNKLTPAPTKPPASVGSVLDQIAKLTSLHEQGILTEAEFKAAQQRLMAAARQ